VLRNGGRPRNHILRTTEAFQTIKMWNSAINKRQRWPCGTCTVRHVGQTNWREADARATREAELVAANPSPTLASSPLVDTTRIPPYPTWSRTLDHCSEDLRNRKPWMRPEAPAPQPSEESSVKEKIDCRHFRINFIRITQVCFSAPQHKISNLMSIRVGKA
jgi:hypothetical protein